MFSVNTPNKLETQSYSAPIPPSPPPITIVKPLSYQFQVVEYMKDDKIVKVELQVQQTTHDEYGNVMFSSGFSPVPRIQLPMIDHK
jgi:hypothetical protein